MNSQDNLTIENNSANQSVLNENTNSSASQASIQNSNNTIIPPSHEEIWNESPYNETPLEETENTTTNASPTSNASSVTNIQNNVEPVPSASDPSSRKR